MIRSVFWDSIQDGAPVLMLVGAAVVGLIVLRGPLRWLARAIAHGTDRYGAWTDRMADATERAVTSPAATVARLRARQWPAVVRHLVPVAVFLGVRALLTPEWGDWIDPDTFARVTFWGWIIWQVRVSLLGQGDRA